MGRVSITLGWFKVSRAALFMSRFAFRPGAVLRSGVEVQLVGTGQLSTRHELGCAKFGGVCCPGQHLQLPQGRPTSR